MNVWMNVLRIVAGLYLLSGVWCLLRPELAASYVGYEVSGVAATAEFFTVYGGIQLGLGIAMLLGSFKQAFQEATLFLGMVFSVTLIGTRLISFIIYPDALDHVGAWLMAELEALIALALGVAYYRTAYRQQAMRSSMV